MSRSSIIVSAIAVLLGLFVVSSVLGLAARLLEFAPAIAIIAIAFVLLHRPAAITPGATSHSGMSLESTLVSGVIIGVIVIGLWLVLATMAARLVILALVVAAAFVAGRLSSAT
jgi:hypothetical protein